MGRKLTYLIQDKNQCCGCGACMQRCPQSCISMQEDEEGFLYPVVNQVKCVHCNLCLKVCPFHQEDENVRPIKAFAANALDEQTRIESSSGGVFTLLASQVIDAGGVVFGAMFNEKWEVEHGYVDNIADLSKLRGSKYVQSRIGRCYLLVKEFLTQGRTVLFSGTPCQVSGLNLFLGNHHFNRLYTVDFICHGVPSPKVWKWYLKTVRAFDIDSISSIQFRNKDNGWRKFNLVVDIYNDGQLKRHSCYHRSDPYMNAFLSNISLRPSCSVCATKSGRSHSDITLADFWNAEKILDEVDDDRGLSLVLINSDIGGNLLSSITGGAFRRVDFDHAIVYNKAWSESYPKNSARRVFFSSYERHAKEFDRFLATINQERVGVLLRIKRKVKKILRLRK